MRISLEIQSSLVAIIETTKLLIEDCGHSQIQFWKGLIILLLEMEENVKEFFII